MGVMLGLVGCPSGAPERDADSTGSGTSTTTTADPSPSTTAPADDTHGTSSSSETGIIFLPEPDMSSPVLECDLYEQDCPPGDKCMIWARDEAEYGYATRCFPVVEDPAASGEPCHVEGGWYSGIDDCDGETMCWEVDADTLEGVCRPFCVGSVSNFSCEDPDHVCPVSGSGNYSPCVPICNPLEDDCGLERVCVPHGDHWICYPDASGDMGSYGDHCEFINVCDPGLVCLSEDAVPPGLPCEGSSSCCTEVCDITDPLGSLQCTGVAQGQQCLPWYAEGKAPAGLEHVGACALPQ